MSESRPNSTNRGGVVGHPLSRGRHPVAALLARRELLQLERQRGAIPERGCTPNVSAAGLSEHGHALRDQVGYRRTARARGRRRVGSERLRGERSAHRRRAGHVGVHPLMDLGGPKVRRARLRER